MTDDQRTASRLASDPPDALREEVEKAMLPFKWLKWVGGPNDDVVSFSAAVSVAVEMVHEEREKSWALEVNQEESDECTAELFALVCAVLDNKPEAGKARESLQLHVEHVRTCQKGSCNTELHGSRLRQRAEAALDVAHSEVAMHARDAEGWYEKYEKEMAAHLGAVETERALTCRAIIAAIALPGGAFGSSEMQRVMDTIAKAVEAARREGAKGAATKAFVAGVAWWEFQKQGATIWSSDRALAENEAEARYGPFEQRAAEARKGGE